MNLIIKFIAEVIGIKPEHQKLLLRAVWVIVMSIHVAWVCGWLAFAGFTAPFASAADFDKLNEATKISAGLQMQVEIRAQRRLKCSLPESDREVTQQTIDKLVRDYKRITGDSYSENLGCEDRRGG